MTGIERLRDFAKDTCVWVHDAVPSDNAKKWYSPELGDDTSVIDVLAGIADQIEREHAQTVEDHEKQRGIIRDLQRERDEALRAAAASRRVSSELRTLAGEWDEYGLGGPLMSLAERLEAHEAAEAHVTEVASKTYTRDEVDERKASCDDHASEADATFEGEKVTPDASIAIPVLAVVEEMERHISGVEGAEDSPVARWARELREVVGWPVRGEEDARAAKWVREHGGIEAVSSVFDRHLLAIKRLYRTAFPGEGKNYEFPTVDDCFAELDRRLMPPEYEWPRFDDGEKVKCGDEFVDGGGNTRSATSIEIFHGLDCGTAIDDALIHWDETKAHNALFVRMWESERVKRPAVLAADGEPLEVGQTVYVIANGKTHHVTEVDAVSKRFRSMEQVDGSPWLDPMCFTHQCPVLDAEGNCIEPAMDVWWVCEGDERGVHVERLHVESISEDGLVTCDPFNGGTWVELEPSELYVNRPVLDADGVPIREGDSVWIAENGHGPRIVKEMYGPSCVHLLGISASYRADQLTHTKPGQSDSWEKLEEDANLAPADYITKFGRKTDLYAYQEMSMDLVRRAKALAEREAS